MESNKKEIVVNVEDYNIYLDDKEFFIAVEWLIIPENINKRHEKINGIDTIKIFYHPFINSEPRGTESAGLYVLRYGNKWELLPNIGRLQISATIKY